MEVVTVRGLENGFTWVVRGKFGELGYVGVCVWLEWRKAGKRFRAASV